MFRVNLKKTVYKKLIDVSAVSYCLKGRNSEEKYCSKRNNYNFQFDSVPLIIYFLIIIQENNNVIFIFSVNFIDIFLYDMNYIDLFVLWENNS